jgi:predicted NAD/FAD-binding protein
MTAAWLLHDTHEIVLFEANDYIGGHTRTVKAEHGGRSFAVDTGFIVCNDWTYPNFLTLLDRIGVQTQPSDMSFSVCDRAADFEFCSRSLGAVFAKRSHLWSPRFLRMLFEIFRFNREAKAYLRSGDDRTTLREWLGNRGYGEDFSSRYLVPMLSAIWSAGPEDARDFPARHFFAFFNNHGLLNVLRGPQWRVVRGGSSRYAEKLTAPYRDRIRLSSPVQTVRREADRVWVTARNGAPEPFDQVILACHSDEALAMLDDASPAEQEILGAIPYQRNDVVLHTDTSLLPRRRGAWASWNYHVPEKGTRAAMLTYYMQFLQKFEHPAPFCVTLNTETIAAEKVIQRFVYHHPRYSINGIYAQRRHAEISGQNRTHYCGAYWGYGFHEDGVKSALTVCAAFGRGL